MEIARSAKPSRDAVSDADRFPALRSDWGGPKARPGALCGDACCGCSSLSKGVRRAARQLAASVGVVAALTAWPMSAPAATADTTDSVYLNGLAVHGIVGFTPAGAIDEGHHICSVLDAGYASPKDMAITLTQWFDTYNITFGQAAWVFLLRCVTSANSGSTQSCSSRRRQNLAPRRREVRCHRAAGQGSSRNRLAPSLSTGRRAPPRR